MSESSGESLSASFTDLMTSLAVIFILLLVAATNATVHEYQTKSHQGKSDRDTLIKKLRDAFPKAVYPTMDIKGDLRDPLLVIVVLPEGLLNFVKSKHDIPQPGQDFLQGFIPKLAGVVCATPDTVRSVVIEGYTDETGPDLFNVSLSQDRATAVAKETLTILTDHDPKDYACLLGVMSASGRGKNDLIYVNGKLDEGKSRRVEFHLRVPSFEQRNARPPIQQAAGNRAQVELRNE